MIMEMMLVLGVYVTIIFRQTGAFLDHVGGLPTRLLAIRPFIHSTNTC